MVFWPEFRISPIHLVVLLTSCVFPVFGVHWVGLKFSGIWWNFGSDLVVVDGILVVFGCIVSHSVHFLDCSSVVHSYPFHRYTSSMGTPRPLPANAQSFFLPLSVFLHNFICFFVHFFCGWVRELLTRLAKVGQNISGFKFPAFWEAPKFRRYTKHELM